MEYPEFVSSISKPGEEILSQLTPEDAHLIHMVMGVSGEVGELLDAVKKAVIYRKPMDIKNVIEELGDIEFFLQGIRNSFRFSRDEIIAANVGKLSRRYPNGYSNQAAVTRADKA
jgi:NTP pyrophosphatase (non-canonical NTP hydrolase)